jgi:arabinan endo-1,5-alpha-L-arabinosidase
MPASTRLRRQLTATAAVAVVLVAGAAQSASSAGGGRTTSMSQARSADAATTYVNPVSTPDAPSFPDPSAIHGKDGFWYAYATSDPVRAGGAFPQIPILRSKDLVHWTRVGEVFPGQRPSWISDTAGLWAPDIRFLDGRYVLYYVATDTTAVGGTNDFAIGVATSRTPTGPWKDSGGPLVAPRPGNGSFLGTIDPAGFTDRQGHHWLYWSSFNGGGFVTRLSRDGLHTVGDPKQILIDNRYEGIFVVAHGPWYYAFASSTNCCAGPVTGYTVFAGRSRAPDGPFVDKDGVSLNTSRVGGTQVIAPYGNRWIGTGHNAVVTDNSGQDWFVYHAIPRDDPYLEPTISRRPMLVDRLDWIDGWPLVRAGRGASDMAQRAPVTAGIVNDRFTSGTLHPRWRVLSGDWVRRSGVVSGGYVRQRSSGGAALVSHRLLPRQRSVLADVRLRPSGASVGFSAAYARRGDQVSVRVDRARQALVVDVVRNGRHGRVIDALPADFGYDTWHVLSARLHRSRVTASVSADYLNDPVATVTARLPRSGPVASVGSRRLALVTTGPADVDNVTAARLARPVTRRAPLPRTGTFLPRYSTGFDGTTIPAGWTWVREDPAAHVANGALVWPVENGDLNNDPADAGILLHAAPAHDWVAQAKVTLPLGVDTVRNYQQAGIAAYVNDDDIARLDTVAIWDTRQIEFNRKLLYQGTPMSSGTVLGHSADTVWLRLYAHLDSIGEWKIRAASSTDGRHFDFGGTWVFAAGEVPRIGLVSLGNTDPSVPVATARFDSVKVWRLASPTSAGFPR